MHPEPRQQSWHSRGEKSFLPGTCPCKKQIGFYSGPCEGRKSATHGFWEGGFSHPQGEASGSWNPTRKKRPKSGYVGGYRNSPTTVPLRYPTPKRASGNERAIKKGGAGGIPPRLFASGLSLEKAWIPRPGPGGNPPRRAHPAMVQTEPPADAAEPPRPHAWNRAPTKNDPFGPLPKRSFFFFRCRLTPPAPGPGTPPPGEPGPRRTGRPGPTGRGPGPGPSHPPG